MKSGCVLFDRWVLTTINLSIYEEGVKLGSSRK